MARYLSLEEAANAGYSIEHLEDQNKFVVVKDGEELGVAHYKLLGDEGIDFNSTFVDPQLRGTGIAKLLAEVAVGDDVVRNKKVKASCWFIDGFLTKNPEALATGASF